MKRAIVFCLLLLFTIPAEAGPLYWAKHHKRFLFMESAAVGASLVHARGLQKCRETGVEKCQAGYGMAWASFGFTAGLTTVVLPAIAEGCWKNEGGKYCNLFAYSGSAAQLGFGINQWRKSAKQEPDTR